MCQLCVFCIIRLFHRQSILFVNTTFFDSRGKNTEIILKTSKQKSFSMRNPTFAFSYPSCHSVTLAIHFPNQNYSIE